MRLIDADKLEKRFNEECSGDCGICGNETRNNGVYSCKLIADAPTVEERRQGEWNILQKDDNGIHEIECPFCKYSKGGRFASVGVIFHKLPPFCESCGADLRPEASK